MRILLALLLLTGCAHASEPAWWTWPQLRAPRDGSMLGDLHAHATGPYDFYNSDLITEAHELTHGVNRQINNTLGQAVNAFYVYRNRAMILHEPHCTIADVAARCEYRGMIFQTYLVAQARYWNLRPLYIVDELIAYSNAAQLRYEGWQSEVNFAREMSVYAWAMVATIQELDPGYPDLNKLKTFLLWNDARIK